MRSPHEDSAKPSGDNGPSSQTDTARQSRVLLVDDEESIIRALGRLLRREPYQLVTATSGAEALRLMEEEPADLIITDQRMPGMSGLELLQEVRQRWPNVIRIILSGYSNVDCILDAVNEGAIYKYLTKPWNDEEIKIHIRRAFDQFGLEEQNRSMARQIEQQNDQLRKMNCLLDQRAVDANIGLSFAQELMEIIDAGVISVDPDGLIVGLNGRAPEILPTDRTELIGMPADSVLPKPITAAFAKDVVSAEPARSGSFDHEGRALQWRSRTLGSGSEFRGRVITVWETV